MTDRRKFLKVATAGSALAVCTSSNAPRASAALPRRDKSKIRYCLNMSTIRGQELSVPDQIKVAANAGYDAIEPWIGDIRKFVEGGGSLADLKKQLDDSGLTVESAIGFAKWIVDDDAERTKALSDARSDMELLKSIGGKRIAAPPIGAHKAAGPDLPTIARRYRKLLEVGAETGVTPQLELWGFSKTLSRLGELAYVATESGHADACVLPDFYHIYKGGSDFAGLKMIEASKMHVFHMNDYPANPPRETIGDEHRVYPGDGVCELPKIIGDLIHAGFAGCFSLELFNRVYWKQDAMAVAKTGLEKMKAVVAQA